MLRYIIISLLATARLGGSSPTGHYDSENPKIRDRDVVCDLANMEVDEPRSDCPKTNTLDENGDCKDAIAEVFQDNPENDVGCSAYCEENITPQYGQEVPYDGGVCLSGTDCTIVSGKTVTYTRTWEINTNIGFRKRAEDLENTAETAALQVREDDSKLSATFSAGASYSFSKSVSYSLANGLREVINDTHCGYWTFIPRLVKSCGTLTEAEPVDHVWGMYNEYSRTDCDKGQLKSKKDWCNTSPKIRSDGQADGVDIFVLVDCKTNKLVPMDKQDPAYQYEGVSTAPKPDPETPLLSKVKQIMPKPTDGK